MTSKQSRIKTLVFCTSYVANEKSWEKRYQRWMDHHIDLPIACDKLVFIDDGSPYLPPSSPSLAVVTPESDITKESAKNLMIHFRDNLGRRNIRGYAGWWRSFLYSIDVADKLNVDKIIHIESDAFILSRPLVDFLNQTRYGWHALWSRQCGFPESAIQVICRDQFSAFRRFRKSCGPTARERIAELALPFTSVHQTFVGDRYSEQMRDFLTPPIPANADFATQVVNSQNVVYRG